MPVQHNFLIEEYSKTKAIITSGAGNGLSPKIDIAK
jgi:hypothetical protein